MKRLIGLFSIIILIAACSDPPTSTQPEKGHRVGAWMVYSQKAVWVGEQNTYVKTSIQNTKYDTITVDSPNLKGLIMYRLMGGAIINYIDSTYSDLPAMGTVDIMKSHLYPNNRYKSGDGSASIGYGIDKKRISVSFSLQKINDEGEEPNKFFITVGDSSKLRTFLFNVTGLDSAYNSIEPKL